MTQFPFFLIDILHSAEKTRSPHCSFPFLLQFCLSRDSIYVVLILLLLLTQLIHVFAARSLNPSEKCNATPARLCKTRYNTTAPMYGVSLTSGQPVTIVQKFPDLLQQVVFEVCEWVGTLFWFSYFVASMFNCNWVQNTPSRFEYFMLIGFGLVCAIQ